jgi:hypothetical protein
MDHKQERFMVRAQGNPALRSSGAPRPDSGSTSKLEKL